MGDRGPLVYGMMHEEDPYVRMRFAANHKMIQDKLVPGARVLDIGCYTGDILDYLPDHIHYIGVDSIAEALEVARKRGADETHVVDLERGDLPTLEAVDVVLACELLEHLRDPARLLEQVKPLLKPDGRVLVSLPNEVTLFHRVKMLAGKSVDSTGFGSPWYHVHYPSVSQSRAFLAEHFVVEKERPWIHMGPVTSPLAYRPYGLLARAWPSGLARGMIFRCTKKAGES